MNQFIGKLEKFIKLENSKYPFQDKGLDNFLKFLKTNQMEITLYSKTKLGQIQVWTIEVQDNGYRTHEGILDGTITTSNWTYCKGKNVGKANETTPEEQAEKQARSIADKKIHAGYRKTIGELDKGKGWFQPMLAHKFEHQLPNGLDIAVQPKLDGMRCIVTKEGMSSRNGKPIIGAPHIHKELKCLLNKYPNLVLDGELYNHELKNDFNEIISHVRKTKPTEADLEESRNKIQYHCYDCYFEDMPELSFEDRHMLLRDILVDFKFEFFKRVETRYCSIGDEVVNDFYTNWLQSGYEGQMIRLITSPYENSRSKSLLKRKEFIDEEFEVLDIEEGVGNRSGMMGRMKFRTIEGRDFTASSRGNEAYFKELLENKDKYIGKMATVRYQNMTPDGSPRFPVVITIRDYE